MSKPTIKTVSVYQAVKFEGKVERYFTADDANPRKSKLKITFCDLMPGVELRNDNDHVIIPAANISGIHLESAVTKEREVRAKTEASKKTGIRNTEIKKPR